MLTKTTTPAQFKSSPRRRIWGVVFVAALLLLATAGLLQIKITTFSSIADEPGTVSLLEPESFPISVDPDTKTIIDNPSVESYMNESVASNHTKPTREQGWFALLSSKLTELDWYQNLASPISRILVIESGERAEQVADNFAKTLKWTSSEKKAFVTFMTEEAPALPDGKFYPGKYIFEKDAAPDAVGLAIADRFNAEIRTKYTSNIEAKVPLEEALIIASLLEREAYDFEDMRYISGVIWNRLFIDMKLQLDATLQYVRGSKPNEPWWPVPIPSDKYLKSPYNTYQVKGLPPGPIANPSIDAIVAALNPRKTECLFYFHTNDGTFSCSVTYEEHVAKLKNEFGRGK